MIVMLINREGWLRMCFENTKIQLDQWGVWLRRGCSLGLGIRSQLDYGVYGGGDVMPDPEASVIDRAVAMLRAENPAQGEIIMDYHYRGDSFRAIALARRCGEALVRAEYHKAVGFVDGRKFYFEKSA